MFKLFSAKRSHAAQQEKTLLAEWEVSTCSGSHFYNIGDYKNAILQFEIALTCAQQGLDQHKHHATFMQYYSLASMNLAHALNTYQKQPQSERVLSDAHFNMLSLMVDVSQPMPCRHEACVQAELLLQNLMRYLASVGRTKVADSLEEEFSRLKVSSQQYEIG